MPLRLIEAILPADSEPRLQTLLKEDEVVGLWFNAAKGPNVLARILLDAGKSDAVLNMLESSYGSSPSFRIYLLAVEGTLPKLKEPEPEPDLEASRRATARIGIVELQHKVGDMLGVGKIFVTLAVISTLVAAVGLYADNVAVIIGAMVIAPLLGPNVALSLATALADYRLAWRAVRAALAGIGIVFGLALLIGAFFPVDPTTPEIAARTFVGPADLVLALASGVAGALSITTGVSSALVGVMVAVALVPPLVTLGLLVGAQYWPEAFGALVLVLVNVISINLAGVGTFLVQGVRPRLFWDAARARRATRIAILVWGTCSRSSA
jgi:uncharacterized hydrophobic protein (TIGR00341 family)